MMNFIKTPTPPYQDQQGKQTAQPIGLFGWLASLLRTPTPAYKTAPASVAGAAIVLPPIIRAFRD